MTPPYDFSDFSPRREKALRVLDELSDRPWAEELSLYTRLLLAEAAALECGWTVAQFRPLALGLVHSSARDNPWHYSQQAIS